MQRTLQGPLVVASLLLSPLPLAAQTSTHPLHAGTWIVGGSAELSTFRDVGNDNRYNTLELAPRVLRFVTPHLAVGGSSTFRYEWNDLSHYTTVGIGPTVAYYFASAPKRLLPSLNLLVFPAQTTGRGGSQSRKDTEVVFDGAFALTYLIVPHVGINAAAFYRWNHFRVRYDQFDGSNDAESYGLRFGFSAFVFE
jgi:hypothetical protein